jgi:chromosome segregation ATPase
MISGRQALAQIEQTIEKARQQEAKCEQAYAAATEEVGRLRIQRTEAFRELARLKLDAITQDKVVGQLDAAERQAISLLDSRREALRQLTERRRQAEERVRQAEAQRQAATDALEKAVADADAIRKAVEARVSTNPEWIAARARVDEVTGQAQQAEKKAVQAETDRDEKRRPYEADPLFMYLWTRKFGTAAYRVNPFSRAMDRLVARVVGYDRARANYALLNEIPERLREHARRILEDLRQERDRLRMMERQALVDAGIEAAEAGAARAQAALAEAERRLAETREALAALDRSYDTSVLEGDAPYREAVELLAAADEREDLNRLYQEALATPTPRDEEIVRRIQATDVMITRALRQAVDAHRQLRETAQRRAVIEREWEELRHQGYDTPYGTFGNEAALGNVLGGVLTGAIGGAILGQVLRGGFHHGPSPWDSGFGGGLPIPPPDGFGTGGSFGGGDFRTGGSF